MGLPEVTFFDDFYFWFNTETKKEYYAMVMMKNI